MATIYVEVTRPPFPGKGPKIITHRHKAFSRDMLSPDMTCVFLVEGVDNKEQAIACCLERLAGHSTTVTTLFGERK